MKVKSESEVAQSCPTVSDPRDCSLPGSSIHGIFQARVLEWGAIETRELRSHKLCGTAKNKTKQNKTRNPKTKKQSEQMQKSAEMLDSSYL